MKIERITAAAFEVVSSEQLEEWVRIDANTDVIALELLVASATDHVEGLTGLTLASASYTVEFEHASTVYRLPLYPVSAVQSVKMAGSDITFRVECGSIVLDALPDGPVTATVTAGFANPPAVPPSLRHAIAVLVSAGFDGRSDLTPQTLKTVDALCARHRRLVVA